MALRLQPGAVPRDFSYVLLPPAKTSSPPASKASSPPASPPAKASSPPTP